MIVHKLLHSDGCCGADSHNTHCSIKAAGHDSDGCGCSAGAKEKFSLTLYKGQLMLIVLPLLMVIAAMFIQHYYIKTAVFLAAYIIAGGEFLLKAAKNIVRGKVFDENFLMSIATIGAIIIGEMAEGVAVMIFYRTGEFFQSLAVGRTRRSITSLMDIRPDYAVLLEQNQEERRVSPDMVGVGDTIIIKPGEKVPVDCTVIDGNAFLDTSAITGESVPKRAAPGDSIVSGTINTDGVITARVDKAFAESTVSKILHLVENASSKKANAENFITKFARIYTPVVVLLAVLIAVVPPLFSGFSGFSQWGYRALIFLIISCPCALVISIPLGFFGGIGGASARGILFKGANYMDALNNLSIVATDKTGTLTKGIFTVSGLFPMPKVTEQCLLETAAYAEAHSAHPIAKSLRAHYGKTINLSDVTDYKEVIGKGVVASVDGVIYLAGSKSHMAEKGINCPAASVGMGSVVHVAKGGEYLGFINISDEFKDDAEKFSAKLKGLGIAKTVMLTGDNKHSAEYVGQKLAIDEVYYQLTPVQKVEHIERLLASKTSGTTLAYIGDGINDAPVLARADIGIAMGGMGSDAAIESADVVIMNDSIDGTALAIKIAKRTRRIVVQNIVFALVVKAAIMVLGLAGAVSMWMAIFADVGVALLAVLNSTRALKTKHL